VNKLRALEYFVAAAEEGSFTGAARRLEVGVPAIARLITTLEKSLGFDLFDRSAQGAALTADGQSYLETCRPLLQRLSATEQSLAGAAVDARGTVIVGAPRSLAQYCLLPALHRFHQQHPDIQIAFRTVARPSDPEARGTDVCILPGWPETPHLIHRQIGLTRLLVCAAPEYWDTHPKPQHPRQLAQHSCLLLRTGEGLVQDLWELEREGESAFTRVSGWLVSSHAGVILEAAVAGQGVALLPDVLVRAHLRRGLLVPGLLAWAVRNAPPINLLYRPAGRANPRTWLFLEFVTQLFRDLDAEREQAWAPLHAWKDLKRGA
jgi:LysR family transcriptional regulator for bpeEF and oprC